MLKKSTFGGLHKLLFKKVQDTSYLITACGEQLCLGEELSGVTEGRRTQALILKPLKTFPVPVFDTAPPPNLQCHLWCLANDSPFESLKCFKHNRYMEADGSGDRCTLSERIDTHLESSWTRSLKWPINIGVTPHSALGLCCMAH